MAGKPQSWKKVRDERRKESFIGRVEPIRAFTENLQSDSPEYMVISITGEGGVGKSTLLARFASIATSTEFNTTVVICDDKQTSPVLVMGHIAMKLAEKGISYKEFDERFKKYGEIRQELESDPKVPRGGINLLAMGITDLTIKSLRKAPGVGVFFEYADEKAAGEALAELMQYSVSKWGNKDEVKLLREPEQVLSPLFLELIKKAYDDNKIVIMFDVFERTSDMLSPWLLMLFNFEYGEFDTRAMFVVSGRESLDQHWTELAGLICHNSLEPFSLDEVRLYLSNHEITNDRLVRQIFEDTNGLPVLVELLAAANPQPGMPLPDVSRDAVERFLQWTPQAERRQAALYAAIPRQFNKDIIFAIFGEDTTALLDWLFEQSYLRTNNERGFFYHDKIRELMIRHLRLTDPKKLIETHERLKEYFLIQQNNLNLPIKDAYKNETWRKLELEQIYHATAINPETKLESATNAFLDAIRWHDQFAEQIAQLCIQTGIESNLELMLIHGKELLSICNLQSQGSHAKLVEKFTLLSNQNGISVVAKSICYGRRAKSKRLLESYDDAINDYKKAIELAPDYDYYYGLAETYRLTGQFEEALRSFSKSLEINPKDETTYAHRAMTYRSLGKLDETLIDFNIAIEINPKYSWAIAQRGETYRLLERYDDALKDYNKSIELQPGISWYYARRGLIHQKKQEYEKAILEFNKSIEIDPNYKWAIAHRGYTYRLQENYDAAIEDYDNAIRIDDKYVWALNARGFAYQSIGDYEKALINYERALAIDDKYFYAIENRAYVYSLMKRYDQAISDLGKLILLDEKNISNWATRGSLYWLLGDIEKSLFDFNKAIEVDSSFHKAWEQKSILLRSLNRLQEALDSLPMEISGSECISCIAHRGEIYRRMGRYQDAIADFNVAINKRENLNNSFELSRRAAAYKDLGFSEKMKADIELVLSVADEDVSTCYNKAVSYALVDKGDDAVKFLNMAISKDPSARTYARYDDLFVPILNLSEFQEIIKYPPSGLTA